MKKIIFALFTLAVFTATAQDKPTLNNVANDYPNQPAFKFVKEVYDFGSIKQGDSVKYNFEFTNTGKDALVITNASGSCGCTVPIWPKEPIAPGAKAVIKVTFNSAGKMGIQDKTVTLTSNAKQNPMVLHLKGTVEKPADQPATNKGPDQK